MRKRMICPNIWTNRKFIRLSDKEKILFIGLFSTADDFGKLWYDLLSINASVFPCDNIAETEIKSALNKLHQLNLIVTDEKVIKIHGWKSHQSVPKPSSSSIPEPVLKRSGNGTVMLPNQYSSDTVSLQNRYGNGSGTVDDMSRTGTIRGENKEKQTPNDKDLAIFNSNELLMVNSTLFDKVEYSEIEKLIEEGKHLTANSRIYEKLERKKPP